MHNFLWLQTVFQDSIYIKSVRDQNYKNTVNNIHVFYHTLCVNHRNVLQDFEINIVANRFLDSKSIFKICKQYIYECELSILW